MTVVRPEVFSQGHLPAYIEGYGAVKPLAGIDVQEKEITLVSPKIIPVGPGKNKVLGSIEEVIRECRLSDGMTISFHHCLRNGDYVLNMILDEAARLGLMDLKVAATAIFPIHTLLIGHMESGVVTGLYTNYLSGPVAKVVPNGVLISANPLT